MGNINDKIDIADKVIDELYCYLIFPINETSLQIDFK